MNLENIILSEITQTQKDKYCMIPSIWDTEDSQNHTESNIVVSRVLGEKDGTLLFNV